MAASSGETILIGSEKVKGWKVIQASFITFHGEFGDATCRWEARKFDAICFCRTFGSGRILFV